MYCQGLHDAHLLLRRQLRGYLCGRARPRMGQRHGDDARRRDVRVRRRDGRACPRRQLGRPREDGAPRRDADAHGGRGGGLRHAGGGARPRGRNPEDGHHDPARRPRRARRLRAREASGDHAPPRPDELGAAHRLGRRLRAQAAPPRRHARHELGADGLQRPRGRLVRRRVGAQPRAAPAPPLLQRAAHAARALAEPRPEAALHDGLRLRGRAGLPREGRALLADGPLRGRDPDPSRRRAALGASRGRLGDRLPAPQLVEPRARRDERRERRRAGEGAARGDQGPPLPVGPLVRGEHGRGARPARRMVLRRARAKGLPPHAGRVGPKPRRHHHREGGADPRHPGRQLHGRGP